MIVWFCFPNIFQTSKSSYMIVNIYSCCHLEVCLSYFGSRNVPMVLVTLDSPFKSVEQLAINCFSFKSLKKTANIFTSLMFAFAEVHWSHAVKACVHYFLSNFYFSSNDGPSKTMKNVFYFIYKALFVLEIFKFLYFCLPLFSPVSVNALEVDRR